MSKNTKRTVTIILSILFFVIGFLAGFVGYSIYQQKSLGTGDGSVQVSNTNNGTSSGESGGENGGNGGVEDFGEIQIHFPELNSYYTGDCTIIKVGNTEVLIDAGASGATSVYEKNVDHMDDYIKTVCTDGILEYVVVTHAHRDHYACFSYKGASGSLFNRYQIGTIIDFSQTNQSTGAMYNNYLNERQEAIDAGATHYTATELVDGNNTVFNLSSNVKLTVLNQKYYHQKQSTGENNHSVCTLVSHGNNRHFLFTGDLELEGEESLAELNNLPEVELFKAGHHGSKTSSNEVLLTEIKPKSVCVCCCAGTSDYTDTNANQFPTQEFINRVAPYTDKVYVTSQVDDDSAKTYKSMNGNILVKSKILGLEWTFSNNDKKLKDTVWFLENRQMPSAWATA